MNIGILLEVIITYFITGFASIQHRSDVQTITSADGTKIAYDMAGKGRAVILVGGALSDRSGHAKLAALLSRDFTVFSYDRRGHGDSGDTKPYAVKREIEDIKALIDEAGGTACVYGISSGACLALEASAALGDKVSRLAMYEAPYDEAAGAAQQWKEYSLKLNQLLVANRRADAVEHHLKFVGVPDNVLAEMKASPAWGRMTALAPTIPYDVSVVGDTRSIPVDRAAKVKAKTLVMDGGASLKTMPFMHPTADKIAKAIPNAQRRTLEGQSHDVDDNVIALALKEFFGKYD